MVYEHKLHKHDLLSQNWIVDTGLSPNAVVISSCDRKIKFDTENKVHVEKKRQAERRKRKARIAEDKTGASTT